MRTINKRSEPNSLTQHRCSADASFENYPAKDDLRRSLVAAQRGICCYCLSRIRPEPGAMKIEHWHSQSTCPEEQLAYSNLLASCRGGDGHSREVQHCDTFKGDKNLSVNPANPSSGIEARVRFLSNGRIQAEDDPFQRELEEILNLNLPFLINNRKAALDEFTKSLRKTGSLTSSGLERLRRRWNGESHNSDLVPFCQAIIYWLNKKLART